MDVSDMLTNHCLERSSEQVEWTPVGRLGVSALQGTDVSWLVTGRHVIYDIDGQSCVVTYTVLRFVLTYVTFHNLCAIPYISGEDS